MSRRTPQSSKRARWKAICAELEAELARFSYGSRFYSISDVAQRFDASKSTAIKVLDYLAQRGLIEKVPRSGNIVRRTTEKVAVRLILPERILHEGHLIIHPNFRRLVDGIGQASQLHNGDFNTISEESVLNLFPREDNRRFGFLIREGVSKETLRFLRRHQLPFVFVDRFQTNRRYPFAKLDGRRVGELSAEHLLDLGHRRIAWVTGEISRRNFRIRIKGYRDALRAAGIPFKWELIEEVVPPYGERVRSADTDAALANLLRLHKPPTAIIAGDDTRAMYLLDACARRGITVPDEMSILGFPNYSESSLTNPPLSVLDGQYENVGAAAVKLLLERVFQRPDPSTQNVWVQPELIPRGSTGPAPSAKAVRAMSEAGHSSSL